MYKDDDIETPQNKSGNDEPVIPIPPGNPLEPMPAIPISIPKPSENENEPRAK